jgi:uncharacterized protein YndB with AHSA1/START domain
MKGLDFVLDRTVTIAARRETVFRYFTDSERFAAWWGAGSRIEPRAGGAVRIRFPNAIVAGGEVLEIAPPDRIVFTYGFESGQPIPIGSSRVTVTLADAAGGTLVSLRHELPSAEVRDEHVQGWRYQLAVFANVVANEAHAGAAALADRFFACWGLTDAATRRGELAAIAAPTLAFRDPYSCTCGIDDLDAHVAASGEGSPASARAWRSSTGSRGAPAARSAPGARTPSSWRPTAASPASPRSGAERPPPQRPPEPSGMASTS